MNLEESYFFLNFFINKSQGAFYTFPELDDLVDRGSMALFADYQPIYATSQRIKDAMAPFREVYSFGNPDSLLGVVAVPTARNYLNLLSLSISFPISAHSVTKYVPIVMYNEDEKSDRLNSQIDPVTATSPIGEVTGLGEFQLYPKVQYQGEVIFLRRPVKPFYSYTLISGRVPVYDPVNSVQIEWPETQQNAVLLKALSSIGINLSDQEIEQYAQEKTQQNFMGQNRV